jgi:two-component system response regulator AtoC
MGAANKQKLLAALDIIAASTAMKEVIDTIFKIADFKTTVLLTGESGTGKELIAKAIHQSSKRRTKAFIPINCAAIPENLIESELFGHKRGSFTDAVKDKRGLFEEADGGTILLDEIGELPTHLQVKILRVLQESEIRLVGDNTDLSIDVRVIAATLRDLESDVLEGRFRDDLYYRLNVVSIHIPPLRERKEDIPVLAKHFVEKQRRRLGLPISEISDDAMCALVGHSWPGNIRELENCIERAMILAKGDTIDIESLPPSLHSKGDARTHKDSSILAPDELSIKIQSRMLEIHLITKALEQTKGNRTHAAKLLEISHRTLLYKLKDYGIDESEVITDDTAD